MDDQQLTNHIKSVLRFAPWTLGGIVAFGLLTCLYGFAPLPHLLWSAVIGATWFAFLVFAWRTRSEGLRLFTLTFAICAQLLLRGPTAPNRFHVSMQGWSVALAMGYGLLLLSRPWLFKFIRLEEPQRPGHNESNSSPKPL